MIGLVSLPLAWFRFEAPGYLALLAVLPLLVLMSFRSLSGLGPTRRVIALVTRCLVVALAIAALASAELVRKTDEVAVVFAIDRSNSIPRDSQRSEVDLLKQAGDEISSPKTRMGVVAFDGVAAIEQLPMATFALDQLSEAIKPDQTNLAAGMRMAMALFPADAARRLVIVSDGNENVGDALEEAKSLRAAGVQVDIVPIRYQMRNEVVFERLSTPTFANLNETIKLQWVLQAQKTTRGRILLYHNDELVDLDPSSSSAAEAVELKPGANRFEREFPIRSTGVHRFRAVFEPDNASDDTLTGNNVGLASTIVSGQGRILVLTTERNMGSATLLADQLRREKLEVDVEVAGARPIDLDRLADTSLVVLSNVPRNYFKDEEDRALATYVREQGGGLIMIGGDEAFGAGGWLDSDVEEVMPVSFDVKNKKQIPKGALVLVMHACEIPQGNYWGQRVAVAAVKTLSSRDLVGVLSYQWSSAANNFWDVPLQIVGDKSGVLQKITQMQMGDMPDFDAPMRAGVNALVARTDAAAKHMIVISDFDPSPPGADLLKTMSDNKISCSTVAIGWGGHPIDVNLAQRIASTTGGKFYSTRDYSQLPQIFIKEAQIVRRSLINETPFTPTLTTGLPSTVAGLAGGGVPTLGGYVLTTAKPLAQVPLIRNTEDGQDPILAQWQVGLGKTVAFTSGMWNRWGVDWAAWAKFSKVWAQIARWAERPDAQRAFDITKSVRGGRASLRIDALNKNADAIDDMSIDGVLIGPAPDFATKPLQLIQTGPGVYETDFDAQDRGSYVVSLRYAYTDDRGQVKSGLIRTSVSVPYSPEFRDLATNDPLLRELAEVSGGRMLEADAAAGAVFDRATLPPALKRQPIWEDLIRLMLVLFLIDVAVRRIAIRPKVIAQKAREYVRDMAGRPQTATESAQVLSTLKGAREKIREGARPEATQKFEAEQARSSEELSKALGGAGEQDQPVVGKPSKKPAAESESDFTSRLLRAKRKAKDDMQQDEK